MAYVGHVENFYHDLDNYNLKSETFKAICKSVAGQDQMYYTKLVFDDHKIKACIQIINGWPQIMLQVVRVSTNCQLGTQDMAIKFALKMYPELETTQWKSYGCTSKEYYEKQKQTQKEEETKTNGNSNES